MKDRQKDREARAEQLEHLLEKQAMPEQRNLVTRRLRFENMIEKTPQGRYSICMLNFDPEQIYLEFKHLQRGITYKKISRISKEDCLRILEGDVDWMADSKDKLYQEFCRQVQLNCIRRQCGGDVQDRLSVESGLYLPETFHQKHPQQRLQFSGSGCLHDLLPGLQ